jgi:hypothetical protein
LNGTRRHELMEVGPQHLNNLPVPLSPLMVPLGLLGAAGWRVRRRGTDDGFNSA